MDVPVEIQRKYPEGEFCWAPSDRTRMSQYIQQFGYAVVETAKPESGSEDCTVTRRDSILMVRPKALGKVHRAVEAEAARGTAGDPVGSVGQGKVTLERGELRKDSPKDKTFFNEPVEKDDYSINDFEREMAEVGAPRPKGAPGRGSKYWGGGIPS